MPPRLVPVDYDPFAESHVTFTPVDYNPFDVAATAARMRAAGTAPAPDPRDVAAEQRRQDRNRGVEPAPERTPEDARRLNRIGAGREQTGDREALAVEQQAPDRRREFQSNADATNPDVRNTMAYIGTRLHQLNPQQYPWLYRDGQPLTSQEIGELVMRKSDEITGMSPQDATNYLFGRPEMRPANVAASLGQTRAPPSIQDPMLRHQVPGPDGTYQERTGPGDYSGTEFPTSPEPVADTWTQRAHKFLSRSGDMFSQTFNGILMREAERHDGPASYSAAGDQAFDSSGNELYHTVQSEGQRLLIESRQALDTPGRRAFEAATADLNRNAYHYGSGADSYLTQTAESLVQMLPVIAAGVVTRGRSLEGEAEAAPGTLLGRMVRGFGSEVRDNRSSLGTLYEQQAGQQYGQSRAAGRSPEAANIDATVFGLAEAIPEALPMGSLMQPGGRFLPRLLRTSGFEGASEMMTQIVEDLYSKAVITPDMTWGQVRDDVLNAGALGAGLGAGMHVVEAPFHRPGQHGEVPPSPGETPIPASPPVATPGIRETAAATPPDITPEDHASPLPTDLIAQGKKAANDALATTQADQIVGDNIGHGIGDHVAVTIGGQTRTGQIHDAFTEEDPETGTHEGAVIGWHDGTTSRERFSDLHDAGARIQRQAGAPDDIVMAHIGHAENAAGDARRNPLSTASGPFQFLDSTFRNYYRQVYGTDPGEHPDTAVKNDPAVQRRLMVAMLADTRAALQRAGQEATPGNLYLGHFLGQGGAVTVLRNPNAPIESLVDSRVMHANPFLRGMTGGDVAAWAARRMGGHLSPEQMAAGATAQTEEGPQPDFSWIDRPVDQAGAPTPEAAATTATAGTEGDRGPIIGQDSTVNPPVDYHALWNGIRDGSISRDSIASSGVDPLSFTAHAMPAYQRGEINSAADLRGFMERHAAEMAAPTGDGTRAAPITVTSAEHLRQAETQTNTEPSDAQIEAGNYAKSHVRLHGIDITIENPKGSERSGVDPNGEPWSVVMPATYGYVKRTEGQDGEQVDVYVGDHPTEPRVYVIDQVHADTKAPDEHKAMIGFPSEEAALSTYHQAFSDGKGLDRIGAVTPMDMAQFKEWLKGDTTVPAAGNVPIAPATQTPVGETASEATVQPVPETAAPAASKGFDSAPHIDALQAYGAKSPGSLNDIPKIARALNLTPDEAHKVLGALAARPNSGIEMTNGRPAGVRRVLVAPAVTKLVGRKQVTVKAARYKTVEYRPATLPKFRRTPVRTAPVDFMSWVRQQGGVRSDRHDLRNVGGLARHPGVINNRAGLTLDQLGERMPEAGWTTDRPTEADVLDHLGRGSTSALYRPGEAPQEASAAEKAASQNEDTLRAIAAEFGQTLSDSDLARAAEYMSQGKTPIQAITEAATDAMVDALEAIAKETDDGAYVDLPESLHGGDHTAAAGSGNRGAAEGVAGPEGQPADAGGGGQANAEPTGAEKAPAEVATDLLGKPAEQPAPKVESSTEAQPDMLGTQPGDERRALEKKGEGRSQSEATQKAPGADGGLFDQRDTTGDLTQVETAKPEKRAKNDQNRLVRTGEKYRFNKQVGYLGGDITAAYTVESGSPKGAYFANDATDGRSFLRDYEIERALRDGDMVKIEPAARPDSPVEQAKAVLQNALDVLNGKPTTKIEDAGEKIGGARKDRWAERGMNVGDLEGMTQGEAFQLVTKDAVWPKPDYSGMVESGVAPDAAAGIKLLRDSLAAKPKTDSDEGRRDFIEAMDHARSLLETVRTMADFEGIQQRLFDALGVSREWTASRTEEQKAPRRKIFSIAKGGRFGFNIGYNERSKIARMVREGFPAKAEAWTRHYQVNEYSRLDPPWQVSRKTDHRRIGEGYATKEEAEAAARYLYENEDRSRAKQPERPHLDSIERTGADVRSGRDIDSTDFLKDFGFRGIEYGNWVASDERQTSTNLAYEALHDLASTLDIPPRALSLGGQLALAFGARGKSKFAAHYEPGKLVINLTKISGAGALAHEWGHALDHYFGTLDTDLGTRGAPKGASGWYNRTASRLAALGNLRPEMAQAFDNLMTALFRKDRTPAEAVRDQELRIEQVQAGIARAKEQIARIEGDPAQEKINRQWLKNTHEWIKTQDLQLLASGERLATLKDEAKPVSAGQVESSFYREAKKLSGKAGESGYWARPTEMLARSFETYVFDKIAQSGNVSQYLVQGVEENRYPPELYAGNPYPTGAERKAINAAYDHLFETMAVREGEGDNPELYQRVDNEAVEQPPISKEDATAIVGELKRVLTKLDPSNRFTFYAANGLLDFMPADFREVQGAYLNRVAYIQLDRSHNPVATIIHEIGGHGFRSLNLFTDPEWTALGKDAKERGYIDWAKRHYPALPTAKQEEEAISEMIATFVSRRDETRGFVRTALQKISDFVDALIEAIKAWRSGNPQARQIMRQIESGKIGRRPVGFGLEGAPRAAMGEMQGAALFQHAPTADEWSDQLNHVRDLTGAAKFIGAKAKIAEAFERFRINFQDRVLPLLRTQTAIERAIGRPLTEEEQPYRQEALYTGRVGHQFEAMTDDIVEPLFEAMKENDVNLDELESYLYARHAPERNAKLEKEGVQDGSGMSDIEAAAILSRIDRAGKTEALKNVAVWFDRLNAFAMETRVAGGLMSQDQADAWKAVYSNYAPLRGHMELPEEERPNMGQSGFSVKGPESRRAFGRKSLADDILAHAIVQAQEAVVRAEKNRVWQELYNLAKASPSPDFWQIQKVTMKKRTNPDTGMVESYAVTNMTNEDAQYTANGKINGKAQRVTFNRHNPAAVKAAEAMRRMNEPEVNFKIFQIANQWLSKVNTTFSPDFIVSNIARDLETATANLSSFDMKGLRRDVLASWPQAFAAAERGAFKRGGDSEWDQAWKDYSANGGRIAFNQIESVEQLRKDIAKRFSSIQASNLSPKEAGLKAWEGLKWTFDKIEKANMGAENATRLSVYKNLVDRGVSQKQAAFIAKEITTNFNRRGVYGALVNSLYLFANASIQGNARMIMALGHRRTQKIAGSMIVAGALVAMFNAAMGGDDDDGVPYYDKISDFEKANNLIFMLPGTGGYYLKIPMAYGYNIFPDLGRRTVDVLRGRAHAVDAGWGWLSNALNSFNPIGGQESVANFLAPTLVDPAVDLLVDNRDFADRPIMPEQPAYGPAVPDSQRFWPSIPPYYKVLTDALNRTTGGDQVRSGSVLGVDTGISPETVQYLVNQATGSAGATASRLLSVGAKVFDGDPETNVELNDVPVVRRLVGTKPSWYDRGAFYARLRSVQDMVAQDREYHHLGDQEGQQRFVAEHRDVLQLRAAANQASIEMQHIRRARAQAQIALDRGRITRAEYDAIKLRAHAREERLFAAFDRLYLQTVRDPVTPER